MDHSDFVKDHASVLIEIGSIDSQRIILPGGGEDDHKLHPRKTPLSDRHIESLTALCDAFLPSIDVSNKTLDDSVVSFFKTSAPMVGTPLRVAEIMRRRLDHPKKNLMLFTLWMLSTWIGTFFLCGRHSLSRSFPYFLRLSQVSQKNREKILLNWENSYIPLLRMFFKSLKFLILLTYFTQVNEKDVNQSWEAIGYTGPDPEFKSKFQKPKKSASTLANMISPLEEEEEKEVAQINKEDLFGPLYNGIINLKQPHQIVSETLRRTGFPVSFPSPKTKNAPIFTIKCDAVVVGSGSGGGVIAGILAKAGYKVVVLEKGKYFARNGLSLLEGNTMDQMYQGNGLLATNDMGMVVLAGSTVGGGSTVNWSASIPTPQHVMKEWSDKYGLEVFESKLYREAIQTVCDKMGVQSSVENEGFNNAILRKGCQELGYPVRNIPRNSVVDHYCGWCCLGCKDGKKKGTAETWLVDLVRSGNGVIIPRSEAIRVVKKQNKGWQRGKACGVVFEFKYNGVKELYKVESKVTIVACGALNTPSLLKRSGLKNPQIGKNLHLHPVVMGWGHFPNSNSNTFEPSKRSYEGGIMTAMSTVVADFNKSGYGSVIQTPALHPGMFSALMPWTSGVDFKMRMCRFSRTGHVFALLRDKSSGSISSPSNISYSLEDSDQESLRIGVEKVLRILAAAGAEEIGTHEKDGRVLNVKTSSSHEFERFVKEESLRAVKGFSSPVCSAHQMGSCRMGLDPSCSAVSQTGETWEMEGLYVGDTSVFPTALGVNPMVTVQAIAYCTAQSVLEVLRRKKRSIM
ncbi:long-chain-alcohol oxidase FAO4A-like [Impatiens glandulifera]|uniref:long-chain-alcohol oxidase FAO4A-like n=1 Tax=Impatiens glandulifera TaxID=253017 RepID=UPI001FB14307|nr:long-chain-alcohol oxidase FAO4A-like [Impatiens glandulifera]